MSVFNILMTLAPEFLNTDPVRVNAVIQIAEQEVGTVFGSKRPTAVAYLSAHILSLGNRNGAGGAILSESEGQLSRAYSQVSNDSDYYALTAYGQEFKRMLQGCSFSLRNRMVRS